MHLVCDACLRERDADGAAGPNQFTLLSMNAWFDDVHTAARLDAIVRTVGDVDAHAVVLQELRPDMFAYIRPLMGSLGFTTRSTILPRGYGEAIFLRESVLPHRAASSRDLPNSVMGPRQLHTVTTEFRGHPLVIATAHLESLKDYQAVRLKQLQWSFDALNAVDTPWIFAGDTNLGNRDAFSMPAGIKDAWIECGMKQDHKATWDTRINRNLNTPYSAQCRFDRIFFSESSLSTSGFATVAKQKLPPPFDVFPSDHWGVMSRFAFK